MINMRQVLTGEPIRLRYVKRFSICPRVHEESVAEHSYFVAFISMMIAEDLVASGVEVDIKTLLCRALLHDLDEVFSGDFIRMFKHDNPEVKDAIEKTTIKMMQNFTQEYPAGKNLLHYWSTAKDDDREGSILAYADFLSVVSYIWQEVNAGNRIMLIHHEELRRFGESFWDPRYTFLTPYHGPAMELLCEIRGM